MNRRTCACGAAIICADLDGYDVWLDQGPGGWININRHGHAQPGTGPWKRHTCAHDPRPIDIDRQPCRDTVRRDIAAAETVLNAGHTLTPAQHRAAQTRVDNPNLSGRQAARNAGLSNYTFHTAFRYIREHAAELNTKTTT